MNMDRFFDMFPSHQWAVPRYFQLLAIYRGYKQQIDGTSMLPYEMGYFVFATADRSENFSMFHRTVIDIRDKWRLGYDGLLCSCSWSCSRARPPTVGSLVAWFSAKFCHRWFNLCVFRHSRHELQSRLLIVDCMPNNRIICTVFAYKILECNFSFLFSDHYYMCI